MLSKSPTSIGLIGFGAFGRLIAQHLRARFRIYVHDPTLEADCGNKAPDVTITTLAQAASQPVIILATPVDRIGDVNAAITEHLVPGALVIDVGSVKLVPAQIMERVLPRHVEIVATHPLFGPQSAANGIRGLKIAVCPVRGSSALRVAAFLRHVLGLTVIMTTPEEHDREVAVVQGLTHLIAKVLVAMEPHPTRMTTRSFDLLMEATETVRHDAAAVFQAIEHANPYAHDVRQRFFALANALDAALSDGA